MRCRSVSLSCKGKINHLIRLPEIMKDRLARNALLETLIENACPASPDIVPNGSQLHSEYAGLTLNQVVKTEVAKQFSTAMLEKITAPSPNVLSEGSKVLVAIISRNKSTSDAISDLSKVVSACDSLLTRGSSSAAEIAVVELFLSQLSDHLLYAAQEDDTGKVLELMLQACNVSEIDPGIDWPRAIPRSRHIPNLYPLANKAAQGMAY